ncbi:MAG: CPBP family intramembrane metalloprotease [Coriobacteriia bacterium]|nr:CPBP family intramembrane metalloprotease [Coriobacteriia bacterium]
MNLTKTYQKDLRKLVLLVFLFILGIRLALFQLLAFIRYATGELGWELTQNTWWSEAVLITTLIGAVVIISFLHDKRQMIKVNEPIKLKVFGFGLVLVIATKGALDVMQFIINRLLEHGGLAPLLSWAPSSPALLTILLIVLIAPFCEEFIFRGAIMQSFTRFGANFAILLSAVLYGAFKALLFQSMAAFFAGLFYGYLAQRFSLKWAMIAHSLCSTLLLLAHYTPNLILQVVYVAAFIASMVTVVLKRKTIAAEISARRPASMSAALAAKKGAQDEQGQNSQDLSAGEEPRPHPFISAFSGWQMAVALCLAVVAHRFSFAIPNLLIVLVLGFIAATIASYHIRTKT